MLSIVPMLSTDVLLKLSCWLVTGRWRSRA